MDAVEFLKAYHRICKSQEKCETCPLNDNEVDTCIVDMMPSEETAIDTNVVVATVEQWAKEYPIKTRQSEFLNMFPNASMDDGILLCPKNLDTTYSPIHGCMADDCYDCRRNYWLQEVE